MHSRLWRLLQFSALISPACVNAASAQPAAVALSDAPEAIDAPETMIVTATKRTERAIDVPIAISAIRGDAIENAGINDITSLQRLTPTFRLNGGTSDVTGVTLRLRGVGTTGNDPGLEGSVGVFFDGAYLSRPGVALTELVDVEQVEILRGPQGTLFGRNTSAGALVVKTRPPQLNEYEAHASVTYGNENLVNVRGALNAPVVADRLAVRIAGAVRQRDGFFTSVTGEETRNADRMLIRGQLLFEPNDRLQLKLIADYSDNDEKCCDAVYVSGSALGPLYELAGLPFDGGAPAFGPEAINSYTTNGGRFSNNSNQYGVTGDLSWDLGSVDLKYIGSYRDYRGIINQDADNTSLNVFATPEENIEDIGFHVEFISHELRFNGKMFDGRLDWLLGAYYSTEDIIDIQAIELGEDYQAYAGAFLLGIPGVFQSLGGNPLRALAGGVDAADSFAFNNFSQDGRSFSIFAHNIVDLTDRLTLTLGGRFIHETKDGALNQLDASNPACDAVSAQIAAGNVPPPLAGAALGFTCFVFATPANAPFSTLFPLPREFDQQFEDDAFTYVTALQYRLSDNARIYASHSRGFKSGGFNLDPTAAVLTNSAEVAAGAAPVFSDPSFLSERTDAYEIGLKALLADGRGMVSITGFHQDIEDFQVLEFTGIQFTTFNVPKAQTTGIEIESDWRIGENFTANLGAAWTEAVYPDDCDVGAVAFDSLSNLCGAQLTNAPEWTATVAGLYEKKIAPSGLTAFLGGDLRYESERRTSTQPTEIGSDEPLVGAIQPDNAKINLRAGLSAPDKRWSVEVWGRNITDQRTRALSFAVPLNSTARAAIFEPPATYGITLRYRH